MDKSIVNMRNLQQVLPSLYSGITSYLVEKPAVGRPLSIVFGCCDDTVIQIRGDMQDIGPRWEAGTLSFLLITDQNVVSDKCNLSRDWCNISKIGKLEIIEAPNDLSNLLRQNKVIVESGISMTTQSGGEVIMLASESPYRVELLAPFYAGNFRPQYDLSQYNRSMLKRC